jgi:hypothetical protein
VGQNEEGTNGWEAGGAEGPQSSNGVGRQKKQSKPVPCLLTERVLVSDQMPLRQRYGTTLRTLRVL